MNKQTIDLVNPFANIAMLHREGLDYVVDQLTPPEPLEDEPTPQLLIEIVLSYLEDVYGFDGDTNTSTGVEAALANAVNRYLDGSIVRTADILGLSSIPVNSLGAHIERLEQQTKAARFINGRAAGAQLSLAVAKANFEYWREKINEEPLGTWEPYLDGNKAIDMASVPYLVEAAIIGASAGFGQIKGTDGGAVLSYALTALGGSIVVGAGKLIFGWVPKQPVRFPVLTPPVGPTSGNDRTYSYCCDNGVVGNLDADNDEQAQNIVTVIGSNLNTQCSLT